MNTELEISTEERIKLNLPLAEPGDIEKIVHPDENDEKFVASLSEDVYTAINEYLKVRRKKDFDSKGNIYAAKKIGDYVLLWIHEPQVMDGGFELIYSEKKRKIVGSFFAGYKG